MEPKNLTKQAIKKLEGMDYDDKVKLFARLCIMRQNKEISGIIIGAIGQEYLNEFKAELTHHLFDQNDQYGNSRNFSILLRYMMNGVNVYDQCDAYTLCAYMYYYEKFIKLAEGSRSYSDLRYAKEEAFHQTIKFCDLSRLDAQYESNVKFGSLLNKEYRKAVVDYLIKDLKIKNGYNFAETYMQDLYEDDIYGEPEPTLKGGKIGANCVEEYKDEKGNTYYLDADGQLYYPDEIAEYQLEDGILSATDDGFIVR